MLLGGAGAEGDQLLVARVLPGQTRGRTGTDNNHKIENCVIYYKGRHTKN